MVRNAHSKRTSTSGWRQVRPSCWKATNGNPPRRAKTAFGAVLLDLFVVESGGGEDQSTGASVCVVIPAHTRVSELHAAIDAVLAQDYQGPLSVTVVYDRADPDFSLARDGDRRVDVVANTRTPGLAGARNTGILAASAEWVAFCDDDDIWHPTKLRRQLEVVDPSTLLVTCAVVVDFEGKQTVRLAGVSEVTHPMLVRSRMSMLHSSTLVFRREALIGSIGLVCEELPDSQNEDWDILLRASAVAPIKHLDEPLVTVFWGRASHFSRQWESKIASSEWMLAHHPAIAEDPRGAARLMGQIAFAHACNGASRESWRWSREALRRRPTQWRAWLAATVAFVPRSGPIVLSLLHRVGRGV